MTTKTKATTTRPQYIPQMRYDEVEYVETDAPEGAPTFWAKVRASLTPPEINALVWENDTPLEDVWALFAPYVVEWNVAEFDAKGKPVEVPPPAEGGGKQFEYIPNGVFWQLATDIKVRSLGKLDPKRNKQSMTTLTPVPEKNSETSE